MNAQDPNFVQLYSYTAQKICSELLSQILKKTICLKLKTKILEPKVHPLPQNSNNLGG